MVGLAAIQCSLHIAPKAHRIDVVQEIPAAIEVIQLPQCFLRPILAGIRTQLADDHALARDLLGQRGEDVPNVVFLGENQRGVGLTTGFQQIFLVVLAGVLEAIECVHFVSDMAVARCELVTKSRQYDEIHLVGAVRIR